MKRASQFLVVAIVCCHTVTSAQQNVGIGTNNPANSAILELKSNNKGLLIPRISLLSDTDQTTIANPFPSLFVFNTNTGLPDGNGFYFWNVNNWTKIATVGNLTNYVWGLRGNSGTNPNNEFIGTIDNKPLAFKTNNIPSGKIDPSRNNVFFGQAAGRSTISGLNNVYIGHKAGESDTSGIANVFIGDAAGNTNLSGIENVFLGQEAGANNTTGSRGTFIGEDAGEQNKHGEDNIFIGNSAGRGNKNGDGNTVIGSSANLLDSNLTNATAIGYNSNVLFDNSMVFGNTDVLQWLFGRATPFPFNVAMQVGTTVLNGNGAFLSPTGVWVSVCDSSKKEDFTKVDNPDLLKKISRLSISRWKYKGSNEYHIGPTAQEFYRLFNVGVVNTGISAIDPAGISLAAIQELIQKNDQLENEMLLLKTEINELKKLLKSVY